MSDYLKYQHVEKLGNSEVDGILLGDVHVFPKLDGTNAHAWYNPLDADASKNRSGMHYGSRRRELSLDQDNAGFMAWAQTSIPLQEMCKAFPNVHFFGEWLVPHTLTTYTDEAWRKFYVFDAYDPITAKHWHYDELRAACEQHGVLYVPCLHILVNPSPEACIRALQENTFLIKDGEGIGEGVVLKNYSFVNKYGRQTWAKIVTSDFKAKHLKSEGPPKSQCTKLVEQEAVAALLTADIVEKVYANIVSEQGGWESRFIPRLLETAWHDFVVENAWAIVKKYKLPKVNYRHMKQFAMQRIKTLKPEVF